MTSRERLLTALRHGRPDRVPVTIYEHSPYNDAWANREPSYAPLLELERRYGDLFAWPDLDVPLLLGERCNLRSSEERQPDGEVMRTTTVDTPRGQLRSVSRRDPGLMTWWQVEPLVKTDADIERVLSIPRVPATRAADGLRELVAEVGEQGVLCFSLGDAIGHVVGLFDYQDFVLRCVRDDGPVRALLAKAQMALREAVHVMGAAVQDAVFRLWGPEYCGPPLMNPRVYFRRYVVEQDRELTELVHATGNFSVIHCHGRLRELIDMIAETGADGLEPIETLPLATADVTLAEVKARVGQRMCLLGGIQALTLETGTPADMRAQVRSAIAEAASGGGFVLLPTSAPFMVPLTPQCLANTEAMYRAAHEFGVYG